MQLRADFHLTEGWGKNVWARARAHPWPDRAPNSPRPVTRKSTHRPWASKYSTIRLAQRPNLQRLLVHKKE
jgi:hypothetical protein